MFYNPSLNLFISTENKILEVYHKKLHAYPLCFAVSLKETIKYVFSLPSQFKKSGGNLNLKDFFNDLTYMQVKKRI